MRHRGLPCAQSRSQRPRSFWSATGIGTSGQMGFWVRKSRTSGYTAQNQKWNPRWRRSGPDTFLEGVKYGLEKVGKANITLKQKQEEILKIIALTQKDVLAVLPTGYGKSLIYQIMPPLMDYMIICILTKDQPKRSLLSWWCHRSMPW